MGARVAAHQLQHRMGNRLQQRAGQPRRQRNAESIAITGGVFCCNQAAFTSDGQFKQAARTNQTVHVGQEFR